MENSDTAMKTVIATWSAPATAMAHACRAVFVNVAQEANVGPLDESLKWGQPAWRPRAPRMGSTLRMDWNEDVPGQLALFVDCKTDLAARMRDLYPDLPGNDGQRRIVIDLDAPLPEQAIAHLAEMTFGYHRAKRQSA